MNGQINKYSAGPGGKGTWSEAKGLQKKEQRTGREQRSDHTGQQLLYSGRRLKHTRHITHSHLCVSRLINPVCAL